MYKVDILIQGFPGRSVCHGGLGWSTITLLRGEGRVILVDVGAFGVRKPLARQLQQHGVRPQDVTDVVLTHAHYDHAVNFTLFPAASVWISEVELAWAAAQPAGFDPLPELYVQELSHSKRVRRINGGQAFLPDMQAIAAPGHTPGHLIFLLKGNNVPVLFSGDAAKNRAELLSRRVADSGDMEASLLSLDVIWKHWKASPGTLLIPGHDLPMTLDREGAPQYMGTRQAAISAWFAESFEHTTLVDLCGAGDAAAGMFTRMVSP
jgi:N-acyl homoserine lactone hydrolase